MIIMTGRKGMYDFDTYIKLEFMDEKSLKFELKRIKEQTK